ncbi:HAD family hydrolase [Oceanobacillus halotolerans]|uniref:HAD family hydrolase n=1 Tax=Oceanobacillus halotolerans TaxID=2663380 RepID=UPI0013D8E620|nr:HAD family hydrolase [Oceanobacillus halotolerans]
MTYKAVFLDIDGTILRSDHTYESSTREAIQQAKKNNIEVFLATGRPLHEITDLAKDLDIHSLIGYNGAYAIYQDKTIVNEPMQKDIVEAFYDKTKNHGHEMIIYTNKKNYLSSLHTPIMKHFTKTFNLTQNEIIHTGVFYNILGGSLINLPDEEKDLYQFTQDIYLSPVTVSGMQNCYDLIRKNVNKGNAVETVLHTMGIAPEQAIAFGDGMNDKEMLQTVGEGIAMGNAHPDLLQYAKHQTTPVNEDGIFNGLKQLGVIS